VRAWMNLQRVVWGKKSWFNRQHISVWFNSCKIINNTVLEMEDRDKEWVWLEKTKLFLWHWNCSVSQLCSSKGLRSYRGWCKHMCRHTHTHTHRSTRKTGELESAQWGESRGPELYRTLPGCLHWGK
jgi:hypothetical protein